MLNPRVWFRTIVVHAVLVLWLPFGTRSISAFAAPNVETSAEMPIALQSQIVELFSTGQCDQILALVDKSKMASLRPNLLAIVAYCGPAWANSEELFSQAEALEPTGDLIMTLHAKYRWRLDHESANPLWEKVLMFARNPAFRAMANDYLAGVIDEDAPLNLNNSTAFGKFTVGASAETDPRPREFVFLPHRASRATHLATDLSWRHWYGFGSLSVNYSLAYDHYLQSPGFDLFGHAAEAPIALHITPTKDFVFKPVFGFSRIGSRNYQIYYGLGLGGVVFEKNYKQSVQGLVYSDHIMNPELTPLEAAHYRFEYAWEFYPPLWALSSLLFIEHASAGHSTVFNRRDGYIPFSHTDIGIDLKSEYNFRLFTLGFAPTVIYRVDSELSTYPRVSDGHSVSERREDWTISFLPSVTVPVWPSIQLYAWAEWRRIYSNIGPNDYADRNQLNRVIGVALKATLSTY